MVGKDGKGKERHGRQTMGGVQIKRRACYFVSRLGGGCALRRGGSRGLCSESSEVTPIPDVLGGLCLFKFQLH